MLTPVDVWREALLSAATPLRPVLLPLGAAERCVLAAPVQTRHPVPPYTSSAMDGYAVRAADVAGASEREPVALRVVGSVPAGRPSPVRLAGGQALRILTGGVVPHGADAVVQVEHTDGGRTTVEVREAVLAGRHVRRTGEDLPAGAVVLAAGTRLGPGQIAAAAGAGHGELLVVPRPRVAIVSTGDELRQAGQPLGVGQLPDSNGPALAAAVRAAGGEVTVQERCDDDPEALAALLERCAPLADLLVTSGGISEGAENDVVKAGAARGEVRFAKVAMQPGMPQAAGTWAGVPFVGLPGNPVSALVSFTVFVRPLLRRLQALPDEAPLSAVLGAPVQPLAVKRRFVRASIVRTGDQLVVSPDGRYGSHLVAGLGSAEVLLDVPAGVSELPAGTPVTALRMSAGDT